jgi:bifunctional DNase/RNase
LPGESEAAVPVQMELKRIIISEVHEQQVILLKEVDGDRSFHIMIGIFEATSIDRRVKNTPSPRPLTHDLVASVIESMGGELRDIFISELRDHT